MLDRGLWDFKIENFVNYNVAIAKRNCRLRIVGCKGSYSPGTSKYLEAKYANKFGLFIAS
jgi:hypothetical protein